MISKRLVDKARKFSYSQANKYLAPSIFHIDYANEKGQELAEKLDADKSLVLVGTLLMDCMVGQAIKEGRIKEHVVMGEKATKQILKNFPELTTEEMENIINCVRQHHGAQKFHSIEAEICCNADCYRFASVKGVLGGMRNSRDMSLPELIKLYSDKAEEKWNVLSLDICKKELKSQYCAIENFLALY